MIARDDSSVSLLAVANSYPSVQNPQRGAFVQVLMRDMRELGANPVVLAPEKIAGATSFRASAARSLPGEVRDGVEIRRPRYLSFSNRILPGGFSTFRLTVASFTGAVLRSARSSSTRPHLCYGHFLYPAGLSAQRLAQRLHVPSVVALGEGRFDHYEAHFGLRRVQADLARFSGIITVSEAIKEKCVQRFGIPETRVAVFPNAAGPQFYPRPKNEMRRKLGLQVDRPIVAFVGHFDENKGPHRVLRAIQSRSDIGAIFLGSGKLRPTGPQVLFSGSVPPKQVPEWLNAADLFVQPVFVEASSNSMREALACALPIVASDIPTNREFLDPSVATLVDPADIDQIRAAIEDLIDHPEKRNAMGAAALERAKSSRSRDRAQGILDLLEEVRNSPCRT